MTTGLLSHIRQTYYYRYVNSMYLSRILRLYVTLIQCAYDNTCLKFHRDVTVITRYFEKLVSMSFLEKANDGVRMLNKLHLPPMQYRLYFYFKFYTTFLNRGKNSFKMILIKLICYFTYYYMYCLIIFDFIQAKSYG